MEDGDRAPSINNTGHDEADPRLKPLIAVMKQTNTKTDEKRTKNCTTTDIIDDKTTPLQLKGYSSSLPTPLDMTLLSCMAFIPMRYLLVAASV